MSAFFEKHIKEIKEKKLHRVYQIRIPQYTYTNSQTHTQAHKHTHKLTNTHTSSQTHTQAHKHTYQIHTSLLSKFTNIDIIYKAKSKYQ